MDRFLDGPGRCARIYRSYEEPPRSPVALDLHPPDPAALTELVRRYESDGYAVFSLRDASSIDDGALIELAHVLDLGDAFVPPMYREPSRAATYAGNGVNVISASERPVTTLTHPAFQTTAGQALHCDATLQAIGEIPTSILLCASPAAEGGSTFIFNSVAAFVELASRDRSLAIALSRDACLRRTAKLSANGQSADGPAFALRDGELLSRFSAGSADEWLADDDDEREALEAASARLLVFARPGSRFVRTALLQRGQGLIIANDRVAHGRTHYTDAPSRQRRLLRALYRRHPSRDGRFARARG